MNKLNYIFIAIIIALLIFLGMSLKSCSSNKADFNGIISLQNKLLSDTCKYIKSKEGQVISLQNSIDVTSADLKRTKDSLTSIIADMRLNPNKIKYIDRIVSQLQIRDSIIALHDTITKEHPKAKWSDSTKNYTVKGVSEINKTIITDIFIPNSLYLVQGTDGKTYAMNSNPYIKTSNILAVNVVKPKKGWVLSLGIGEGFTKYGIIPSLSLNLGWKITEF